jgi:hypothetical protein
VVADADARQESAKTGATPTLMHIPIDRLRRAVTIRSSCNFIHLSASFKIARNLQRFDDQLADERPPVVHARLLECPTKFSHVYR